MNQTLTKDNDYSAWLKELKTKVRLVQIKAAVKVNSELLWFYWELGQDIIDKQKNAKWGGGFLKQLSKDLSAEFSDIKGFSLTNLKYIKQWTVFYSQEIQKSQQAVGQNLSQVLLHEDKPIGQQVVAQLTQIPWGHHIVIISKCKNTDEAFFYIQKTIKNNWSRAVLTHHIESALFHREGKAITNFEVTLPAPQSDLAKEMLKNPYLFDFLNLTEKHDESELENALVNHVTKFLLELGAGFSYLGRQYKLEIAGDEFFIDLLFYHVKLHCYVVVELKAVKFKPEFAGKLNFYVSAVDGLVKSEQDNPTIGILICKSKNDMVVEYALKDVHKPIGVSEYIITKNLPKEFKSSLPSIEEIETELDNFAQQNGNSKQASGR
ncbi:PDDEXK nuclease domain-containing protein [Candidatus Parabeggiatoa sp. HSG14]|uniref:PDDEXK nuclease domain-containing protein n=1 Tax=Candidatus Parabeggiatoa sp. HSG14 TaxID=3055593 RepID=UPI0025A72535|nr:PDDEXK nuclease domain-containing protein [Thiotrichales bacterium HSG14]